MSKLLLYAPQVRSEGQLHAELLAGVEQLALAVGSTLGPRGLNVIIDRAGETPLVTKDGVTVARNIQLTDPVQNAAVKLVQDVARATVDEAGDGTTTATVLAYELLKGGLELVRKGVSPVALQRHITGLVDMLATLILAGAQIPTDVQIAQVATIATNGNRALGLMLADAVRKVGREGHISLDDSKTGETWLELRDGFRFEAGFSHENFITDRKINAAVLEDPYILITERQLSQGISNNPQLHDLGPLIRFAAGLNKAGDARIAEPHPLLIICDDLLAGSDAAQTVLLNHAQQKLQLCVVRAPEYGEMRRAALADIAMATGGQVLASDGGHILSNWVYDAKGHFTAQRLGRCRRAIIYNNRAILEDPAGDPSDPKLLRRFGESLREQAQGVEDPRLREQLLLRAARLTGAVAVIRVGAATEAERRALRDSVEDAVLAVRAALAEGIVPGGGLCLLSLAHKLDETVDQILPEARPAARLLSTVLRTPLRQIARNAGKNPDDVVDVVMGTAQTDGHFITGYDAAKDDFVDMVAAGIVDPAKVVRVALKKAASISALMLTSSCMVYLDPQAAKTPIPSPYPNAPAQAQGVR